MFDTPCSSCPQSGFLRTENGLGAISHLEFTDDIGHIVAHAFWDANYPFPSVAYLHGERVPSIVMDYKEIGVYFDRRESHQSDLWGGDDKSCSRASGTVFQPMLSWAITSAMAMPGISTLRQL